MMVTKVARKSAASQKAKAPKKTATVKSAKLYSPKKPATKVLKLKTGEEVDLKLDTPKDANSQVDILMVVPQPDGSLRIRRTVRSGPVLLQHD